MTTPQYAASIRLLSIKLGYKVTVFDQCDYSQSKYDPEHSLNGQAASADHNKIVGSSIYLTTMFSI